MYKMRVTEKKKKKKKVNELLQLQHTNDLGFITFKRFFGVSKYVFSPVS